MDAITDETFQTVVLDESARRPVLVDFWGPTCVPCLKLMPWVEQLAADIGDRVHVVKLNTAEYRRLGSKLRVMGVPTVILYKGGEQAGRLTGPQCTPSAILGLLKNHVPEAVVAASAPR